MRKLKILILGLILSLGAQNYVLADNIIINEDELASLALAQVNALQNEQMEVQKKVEELTKELESAREEGAQKWFKRIAKTCGVVAAGSVIVGAATLYAKGGLGIVSKEIGYGVGGMGAIGGGACAAISATLYTLTNDRVEELETLVKIARAELNRMSTRQSNK